MIQKQCNPMALLLYSRVVGKKNHSLMWDVSSQTLLECVHMTGVKIMFIYKQMLLLGKRLAALIEKKTLLVLGQLPYSTISE
jgi:hypothetical protein